MRIIPKKRSRPAAPEALRRRGLRLTNPRRLILEVVQGTDVHPTAEWIHRRVRRGAPRVSLGTVYRNLRLLAGEGLVREMADGRGLGRFDGNLGDHQHVICSDCGRISDLDVPFDLSAPVRAAARAAESSCTAAVPTAPESAAGPAVAVRGSTFTTHMKEEEESWQGRVSREPRVTRT